MVQPEDLIQFGLIPEFVGRIPVVASLSEITEQQLVEILTAPKNAIVRQFEKDDGSREGGARSDRGGQ